MIQKLMNLRIKDRWVIISFIILLLVLWLAMWEISNFMPILETCSDEFAIIEKCGCIPWK